MILGWLLSVAFVACHLADAAPKENYQRFFQKKGASKHWALLVAGSEDWYNYRHQADVCHAYQILKWNGIRDENIITMMYDDIAYNDENPTPGVIKNHPNGPNVYDGVKIDYRNDDVNSQNFLAVLRGDKEAMKGIGSGKVIESGPNDHVFVFFSDHGDAGILVFPTDLLGARDLINTLKKMHKQKKYGQMVLYIEACLSGSMFSGLLPSDINIYATTAANPDESSYACYYDESVNAYLGDEYSVNWMEDSDKTNLGKETLREQYEVVKKATTMSHVMEYGDKTLRREVLLNFQGEICDARTPPPVIPPKVPRNPIPSEEVPLVARQRRLATTQDEALKQKLQKEIEEIIEVRKDVTWTMNEIVDSASYDTKQFDRIFSARHRLSDFDCYEPVLDRFRERCFDIVKNDWARKQLRLFVNMCEEGIPSERIVGAIDDVCDSNNHHFRH